jgi:hypothetical protein
VDIKNLTDAGGATIEGVPGHSMAAYVIGNRPSDVNITPAVGMNLNTLKEIAVNFSTQSNIENVTLFGGDTIKNENPGPGLVAKFDLAPVVARIEIEKISSTATSDIASFNVEGIFINNYYESIMLKGFTSVDATKNGNKTDFVGGSAAYPTGIGTLYDYRTTEGESLGTASGSNAYVPTSGVWAYNLLAPTSTTSSKVLTAPHIVIPISNIETKSGMKYDDIWYLTVAGLVCNGEKIDHLEPGKIYSISDISFSHTNIQPKPEMETIDVTVAVTLVKWETVNTDVIFGQD